MGQELLRFPLFGQECRKISWIIREDDSRRLPLGLGCGIRFNAGQFHFP
jgi:hypothetical protein